MHSIVSITSSNTWSQVNVHFITNYNVISLCRKSFAKAIISYNFDLNISVFVLLYIYEYTYIIALDVYYAYYM